MLYITTILCKYKKYVYSRIVSIYITQGLHTWREEEREEHEAEKRVLL